MSPLYSGLFDGVIISQSPNARNLSSYHFFICFSSYFLLSSPSTAPIPMQEHIGHSLLPLPHQNSFQVHLVFSIPPPPSQFGTGSSFPQTVPNNPACLHRSGNQAILPSTARIIFLNENKQSYNSLIALLS